MATGHYIYRVAGGIAALDLSGDYVAAVEREATAPTVASLGHAASTVYGYALRAVASNGQLSSKALVTEVAFDADGTYLGVVPNRPTALRLEPNGTSGELRVTAAVNNAARRNRLDKSGTVTLISTDGSAAASSIQIAPVAFGVSDWDHLLATLDAPAGYAAVSADLTGPYRHGQTVAIAARQINAAGAASSHVTASAVAINVDDTAGRALLGIRATETTGS